MRYFIALFAVFALVVIVYFERLNPESLTVNLSETSSYSISTVGFFLFSFALGAFIVILLTLLRDARTIFRDWRNRQRERTDARVQDIFSRGLYAYLSGKYDQAISFFRDIMKIEPNHFYTLLRIGDAYQQERNYAEAIKFHKRARKIDDKSLEAQFALANDYALSGSYDEAISIVQEVVKKDSSNVEALMRLREIYVKITRWDGAHEIQGRIVKYRKDNIEDMKLLMGLRYEFARYLYAKGDKDKGKRLMKAIIRADKDFVPAYVTLGDMLIEGGESTEAADLWERGYYMNYSEILLHKLEDFYLQQGEPEKIIWIYKKAISLTPDSAPLRFYLGKLYYRLEMLDEAFEVLYELEGTESGMPELYKLLGNIYERKEEFEKAITQFKKAMGLRKRVMVPYYCPACDYHTFEWSGRCVRCGGWNTFTVSPVYIQKDIDPSKGKKWQVSKTEPSYRKDSVEWSGA
jgi:lipopolysaccharide biosynthesis regulator YciM